MTEWLRFALCAACALFGLFAAVSGVLGVYRFRYSMNRIHAAALIDTIALLFLSLSVMIATGIEITSLKIFVVVLFQWLTSPVSSHLIAKLVIVTDSEAEKHMIVEDKEMLNRMKEGN